MEKLITHTANALRFLMTEDIYDLGDAINSATPQPAPVPILTNEDRKLPVVEDKPAEMKPLSFDYLGENNRYFLIIVDDKTHPSLNTTHKEMLMKIMAAKKIEIRDLAIL